MIADTITAVGIYAMIASLIGATIYYLRWDNR